MVSYINPVEHF